MCIACAFVNNVMQGSQEMYTNNSAHILHGCVLKIAVNNFTHIKKISNNCDLV